MKGEQKDTFTIWLTLRQRTLHYETYVMPAPEENHQEFYEHLLRRNLKLYGAAFAIGEEDAVFLVGQVANEAITDDELDRILGSLYAWVEQFFRPALRRRCESVSPSRRRSSDLAPGLRTTQYELSLLFRPRPSTVGDARDLPSGKGASRAHSHHPKHGQTGPAHRRCTFPG